MVGRGAGGPARTGNRRRDHPRRPGSRTNLATRHRDDLRRRLRGDAAPPPPRDGRLPRASSEVNGWRREGRPLLHPLRHLPPACNGPTSSSSRAGRRKPSRSSVRCCNAKGTSIRTSAPSRPRASARKAITWRPHGSTAYCVMPSRTIQAWHTLGYDLFHAGDLEGAAEAFSRALKLEPTRASAHFNLARIAARLGDKSKVIEHFARAVELQPDYKERLDEDPDLLPFKEDPDMLGRLPGGKVGEDPYQEYYATRS